MALSLQELNAEIDEKTRDHQAFSEARAIIRRRVLEVRDSKSQLTPLPIWSGTDAVLGSLDLAIHSMERTLSELIEMKQQMQGKTAFTVVEGGKSGGED